MVRISSVLGRLTMHAFLIASAAFALGLCAGHVWIQRWDELYAAGMLISGACLTFVLMRTYGEGHKLTGSATSDDARKTAGQFVWSCVFFAMISSMFGMSLSGIIWHSADFLRTFGLIFWGVITAVAVYPVRRDAKRLAAKAR